MALATALLEQRNARKSTLFCRPTSFWRRSFEAIRRTGCNAYRQPCSNRARANRPANRREHPLALLIRSSQPADPMTPVSVPGDGAADRASSARRDGFSAEPRLWRELNSLAPFSSHCERRKCSMTLFAVARLPREILFGAGQRHAIAPVAARHGRRALVCTDERFSQTAAFAEIIEVAEGVLDRCVHP